MNPFRNYPNTRSLHQQVGDIAHSLNTTEFTQEIFDNAIIAISNLCKNHASIEFSVRKGNKICGVCYGANQGEQYSCGTAECEQIYHTQCVGNQLAMKINSFKEQISQCIIQNKVDECQISLDMQCLVCGALHIFPQLLQDYIGQELSNIQIIKQQQKEQIRQQSRAQNIYWSSCQGCQESWILPNLQRKIHEIDPFDEKNLIQSKPIPLQFGQLADGVQKEKTWIRFSQCKHLFCKGCLSGPIVNSIQQESNNVQEHDLFNHIICPEKLCTAFIGFKEIERVLSNNYNWFIRYKHNLMMNCIKQLPGEFCFIRCLGIYKINSQNCEYIKFDNVKEQIAIQKEVWEKFHNKQIDLSQLNCQKNAGERMEPCGRVYHYNKSGENLQRLFQGYLNNIQDKDERESLQPMFEEYIQSGVISPTDLAKENDKNMFKCQSDICQFSICLNGCLQEHPNNVCPLNGNNAGQNNPVVIVPLDRIAKEVRTNCLYFARSDNIIISPSMQFCFICFRQLKVKQGVKPTDQIVPGYFLPCDCANG